MSTIDSRNGMRQPPFMMKSSPKRDMIAKMPDASSAPAGLPSCVKPP